jgi:hypothetical protein
MRPLEDWESPPGNIQVYLLNHAYWTRIWIVQEFLLAKSLVLIYGMKELRWNAPSYAFDLLQTSAQVEGENKQTISLFLRIHAMKLAELRKFWEAFPEKEKEFDLKYVISQLYQLNSIHPHDKVYGLLGLVSSN